MLISDLKMAPGSFLPIFKRRRPKLQERKSHPKGVFLARGTARLETKAKAHHISPAA